MSNNQNHNLNQNQSQKISDSHSNLFIDNKSLRLPDHTTELNIIENKINYYKKIIEEICLNNNITLKSYSYYYNEIYNTLETLGTLSKPIFKLFDVLEIVYNYKYSNSPNLAKQLWLEHYDSLHHPYSILKNRCFNLLDDLDNAYIIKFNKYPPNWID